MTELDRKRELSEYRISQAYEAISEAQILGDSGHYRGAINRSYYAMFYALQVLVIQDNVKVTKHSGAISHFDRWYVKTGKIDREFSRWLHRLFDLRQDADYGDMYEPSESQCREAIEKSEKFVERIRSFTNPNG